MRPLAALVLAFVLGALHPSAQEAALPDMDTLFAQTKANLVKSLREQVHYAYRERRSDIHTNPFGKIGTEGNRVFDVTPGDEPGVYYRRLIERDGQPVNDSKPERIEPRRRERPPEANGRSSVDDALDMLDFKVERRETDGGRSVIVVGFAPKPGAVPSGRTGKLAKAFKGEVRVDEAAREVVRIDGVAVDDLTYGFGLLARINEGTRVTVTREKVDSVAWLPTSVRFKGEGRAMLVRKLVLDYAVDWFDYRRVN